MLNFCNFIQVFVLPQVITLTSMHKKVNLFISGKRNDGVITILLKRGHAEISVRNFFEFCEMASSLSHLLPRDNQRDREQETALK